MPRSFPRLVVMLFTGMLAWSAATAQAPKTAPVQKPVPKPLVKPPSRSQVEISIPYPNAGMYLYRGIYGSFAGGRFHETELVLDDTAGAEVWKDPIFQWQGEVSYFYTDWFSAGFGFKINSGETQGKQFVENRYFLLSRMHYAWRKAAVYGGLSLGVNDVSISLGAVDTGGFDEPLQATNAAIGLEAGGGWKFSKYVGATLGQRVDVSLAPNVISGERTISFHTQPGLALDMTKVTPSLRESVKALYILAETQFGQKLVDEGDWTQDFAWILGISLAF
jgi:hypothetical protein